ncbi:MAG: DUF4153 domain-containing protein [Gracilimonas sp.]|uniref:DUF4153 domain-containing protein n=1 Tax=Gracilimonas sp. TaxID=1974203 RepID=UPI00199EE2EF|nr:DUF4153 domain-containing protein [Gracilimonas sp.]MBD3616965.1 DUF4153 domain-containing protein [Gracilimonas sp.]
MNLRFPSLTEITEQGFSTFKRFPFALTVAFIGTLCAMWLAGLSWGQQSDYFFIVKICWVSALSISVFLSLSTLAESRKWTFRQGFLTKMGALVILLIYYYLLPDNFSSDESEPFFRYLLFFIAAHLFVSFAPFLQDGEVKDFWAYNKTLFLRILTAALYTMVLFAGLSIAMLSLENLLEIDISGKRYSQLWIFLAGLFNTWFFLAGVPHPNQMSESERKYPGGLKIFVQYILIPLITVYILILYAYTGKIILEWEWPIGWVANLVLSFSIAGILALLLLHPIRNQENNRWINLFSKGYYIALIPLVLLLMLSIWVRISEYGVTVNRYFVATLAVWLAGIVIYFLVGKSKNIKVIPISLCVIALLISFGPLGAFEVSKRSQLDRFEQLLEQNELLSDDNKIIKGDKLISFEDRKQISSKVDYLLELKGSEPLQPYFEEDLEEYLLAEDSSNRYNDAGKIMRLMGMEYVAVWQREDQAEVRPNDLYYLLEPRSAIPVSGYQFYLGEFIFNVNNIEQVKETRDSEWTLSYNRTEMIVRVESITDGSSIKIEVLPLINKIKESGLVNKNTAHQSIEMLTVETENESLAVKAVFKNINGFTEGDEVTIQDVTVVLFVTPKK